MSYTPSNEFYAEVAKGNILGHSIVNKYGANAAVPNGTFELVSTLSAAYAGFLAAVSTVRIKAGGNAADDTAGVGARSVFVEGVDSTLARLVEELATAGAGASGATTGSFWRIDRSYCGDQGAYATPWNTGAIVIENSGGGTDLIQIDATAGQTLHCAAAIPDGVDAYLIGYELSVDSIQPADFRLYARGAINDVAVPVAARRLKRSWAGIDEPVVRELSLPSFLVAGPADVYIEAAGNAGAAAVTAAFDLLLVEP